MSIYPIPVPTTLHFRNAAGRNTSLSSAEIDGNFALLETNINKKLDATAFNVQSIKTILSDPTISQNGGIDSAYLRGLVPADWGTGNIVARDGNGNFSANIISASLHGNADSADTSLTANRLKVPVKINNVNFDGSGNITVYDDTKLPKTGGQINGKLTISNGSSGLNLTPLQYDPPTTVGDVYLKTDGVYVNTNGSKRQLAFMDSDIRGTASSLSQILAIQVGGTGGNSPETARNNLDLAKRGDNWDITSLNALSTPLKIASGGTGLHTSGGHGGFLISDGNKWTIQNFYDNVRYLSTIVVNENLQAAVNAYINSSSQVSRIAVDRGFQMLPGGFTLNWGRFGIAARNGAQRVWFGYRYPRAFLGGWIGVDNAAAQMIGVIDGNNDGMTVKLGANDANRKGWWFAIGI